MTAFDIMIRGYIKKDKVKDEVDKQQGRKLMTMNEQKTSGQGPTGRIAQDTWKDNEPDDAGRAEAASYRPAEG
jgi:hypothetical protein